MAAYAACVGLSVLEIHLEKKNQTSMLIIRLLDGMVVLAAGVRVQNVRGKGLGFINGDFQNLIQVEFFRACQHRLQVAGILGNARDHGPQGMGQVCLLRINESVGSRERIKTDKAVFGNEQGMSNISRYVIIM